MPELTSEAPVVQVNVRSTKQTIEGFGEVFRALSLQEIGSSTVQSRAIAGLSSSLRRRLGRLLG